MFKSLRWRIQAWHAVILAAVILSFAVAIYGLQRRSRLRAIDGELAAAVEVLAGQLRALPPDVLPGRPGPHKHGPPDGRPRRPDPLRRNLRMPNTFAGRRGGPRPYFVIRDRGGTTIKAENLPGGVPTPDDIGRPGGRPVVRFRDRGDCREAFAPGPPGTIVLVGRSIAADLADLADLRWLLAGIGGTAFVLGLAGGWVLSQKSVRPVRDISRVAAEVTEKELSARIDTAAMDVEFAGLAETLNDTFARLETAFAQQVEFTADASHELRTPLAVLRMHLELALSKERTGEEYRETLRTCLRAAGRMSSLVESLLGLARMDAGGMALESGLVDLGAVVAAAVEDARPLAEAKGIRLAADAASATVLGDRGRLGQLFTNLLANAVAYSPRGASVSVAVRGEGGRVTATVADTGVGIAPGHLPDIFRRFYRVNKERSRDGGGSGLGLSICKMIAEAHGGAIAARSRVGVGSTFTVTLPSAGRHG